ncbi:hypothetical protein GIB67_007029 [Kingdonia uniflora]|uniref:Small auxin up regulated protein n=1 Tax=Kingdonia uniflora TaxID=39325 RepID=A0A7J7NZA0_9MAGN|nr:hypothetical protein GIB67_007029 [Kingdonia uniflora]
MEWEFLKVRLKMKSSGLIKMVRRWQKSPSSTICKGHFVVYVEDGMRFKVPLSFLNRPIFKELFKISAEKFGLPRDGPIRLPCDASFMAYVVSILQRHPPKEVEKALVISL